MRKLFLACALLASSLAVAQAADRPEYRYYMAYVDPDTRTSHDVDEIAADIRAGKTTLAQARQRAQTLVEATIQLQRDLDREPSSPIHSAVARLLADEHRRLTAMLSAIGQEVAHGQSAARASWTVELEAVKAHEKDQNQLEQRRNNLQDSNFKVGELLQRMSMPAGSPGPTSLELRANGKGSAALIALDRIGKTVWRSPISDDSAARPYQFNSSYMAGEDKLDVAGPLGRDGSTYLVRSFAQSDVRANWFAVLQWKGASFQPGRDGTLMAAGSDAFHWTPRSTGEGEWIAGFRALLADGSALVDVEKVVNGPAGSAPAFTRGTAVVAPDRGGFHILRWVTTLRQPRT